MREQAVEITKRNCVVREKRRDFPVTYPVNVIFEAETGCIEAEVGGGNSKHGSVNTAVAAAEIEEGRGIEEAGPAAANGGERLERRRRDTRETFQKKIIWKRRERRRIAVNVDLGLGLGLSLDLG